MYDELPKSERDRYRARRSYWKRKGLSDEEAEKKAALAVEDVKTLKLVNNAESTIPADEKVSPSSPDSATAKCRSFKVKKTSNVNEIQISGLVDATFYAVIVAIASWLLISSSLEVFGKGPEGWGKAIILELGILGLAVSKSRWGSSLKEMAGFLLSKATLIFLVILSFAVLHTGVESQRSEGLTTAESTSTILAELIAERDLWQKTYDSYAENRVSDRRDAMKEISRLNEEIRKERAALSQSLDGSVVNLKSNTEMMIRAALLLLNIIFGHKLAQAMATIKWPPLWEERLVVN
ncbi:MAG: hypothetical protein ACOH5I_26725 [Oligoflexus sp.]